MKHPESFIHVERLTSWLKEISLLSCGLAKLGIFFSQQRSIIDHDGSALRTSFTLQFLLNLQQRLHGHFSRLEARARDSTKDETNPKELFSNEGLERRKRQQQLMSTSKTTNYVNMYQFGVYTLKNGLKTT